MCKKAPIKEHPRFDFLVSSRVIDYFLAEGPSGAGHILVQAIDREKKKLKQNVLSSHQEVDSPRNAGEMIALQNWLNFCLRRINCKSVFLGL